MFFVGRRFEEKLFQMIFESADSWENLMEDIGCSCDQVCVREREREWENEKDVDDVLRELDHSQHRSDHVRDEN